MATPSQVHPFDNDKNEGASLHVLPMIVMLTALLLSPFIYDLHQWLLYVLGVG